MSTVLKLSYRSDLRELGRICQDVAAYCREHDIDPDTALALTLCLDELFTNTLKYGYRMAPAAGGTIFANETTPAADSGQQQGGSITSLLVEIHLERHEDHVLVHYHDRGQFFDPFANLPPLPDVANIAPETLPTGGFGIHLLRKLSSEACYARQGDLNKVSLRFNWR